MFFLLTLKIIALFTQWLLSKKIKDAVHKSGNVGGTCNVKIAVPPISGHEYQSQDPLTLSLNVNVCVCICVTFQYCIYGDVDIDAKNGYRTHSLHSHFVIISSIIFKNANAGVGAKCECAFIPLDSSITRFLKYLNVPNPVLNRY